jgi:hypothetical protein
MRTPLQNRVAPDGTLQARPERGLLMGNRGGRLHTPDRRLGGRRWVSKAWIACEIAFRGRRRVMGAGYTELFFLDEVTALAAGHRPCFECRRADALAFAEAFARAHRLARRPRAGDMDALLHTERLRPPETLALATLPDGAVFLAGGRLLVPRAGALLEWSFAGYVPATVPPPVAAPVLTPPSVRAALAAGYTPRWHPSAVDQKLRLR